jgi:putative ABC transport system ATP-binding protein
MMNAGKVILDVKGEEKKNLTIEALLEMFTKASGAEFASDRALLG